MSDFNWDVKLSDQNAKRLGVFLKYSDLLGMLTVFITLGCLDITIVKEPVGYIFILLGMLLTFFDKIIQVNVIKNEVEEVKEETV